MKISAEALLDAQMKMAIGGYLAVAAITGATTFLLYFFFQQYTTTDPLYIQLWAAMQLSLCMIWIMVYYRYGHDFEPIKSIWAWWIEVPLSAFSGLGWGLTWVFFINPDNLHVGDFLPDLSSREKL